MIRSKQRLALMTVGMFAAVGMVGAMVALAQPPRKTTVPFVQSARKCVGVAVTQSKESPAKLTVFRAFEDGTVEFQIIPDTLADEATRPAWLKPAP